MLKTGTRTHSPADKTRTAKLHNGLASIRRLPLLDTKYRAITFTKTPPHAGASRLELLCRIALELKREKAALAVMKRAIKLSEGEFASQEERAKKAYGSAYHYDYGQNKYLGSKGKAKKLLSQHSPIAWLRDIYVKQFNKKMKNEDYAGALKLAEAFDIWDGRKKIAAEALVGQKKGQGFEKEAEEIRQIYLWASDLTEHLKKEYGSNSSRAEYVRLLSLLLNNSENVHSLKDKRILDLGSGSTNGRDGSNSAYPPALCRSLAYFGAKPVGIDIKGNEGEKFENYSLDLRHASLGFLASNSFDAIHLSSFLSLTPVSKIAEDSYYAREYSAIGLPKVSVDGKEFAVGVTADTSPNLYDQLGSIERRHSAFLRMGSGIFSSALSLLKENGFLVFDNEIFAKKEGRLRHSGNVSSFLEKNTKGKPSLYMPE